MYYTIFVTIASGMRTFTGFAVVCWAAYLGYLPVEGTWASWTAKLATVIVMTVLALGEYWGDTQPKTPSRKSLGPLLARLSFGVLAGMVIAAGLDQPKAGGVILGIIGALIGTYGGYRARAFGARLLGRDLPVALFESAVALGLAAFAMWHVHQELLWAADPASMLKR
jgi:uncharacterized membrane protein